jgi:hypothetical protein
MDSLDSKSAVPIVRVESMARRVASVCDRHRISRGRPADLVGFLRALGRNKHLAMDFWRTVSRMSVVGAEAPDGATFAVETAALPDWRGRQERTLEAIVRAIAGTGTAGMAAAGVDAELAAMHMASLLAGDDTLYDQSFRGDEAFGEAGFEDGRARGPVEDEVASMTNAGDPIPYVRMGDDELRRVLLGPADTAGAAIKWRVRIRLPLWPRMWLRRWASRWTPLVPPKRESAPRRMGLMLIFLALLAGAGLYAQSAGSLEDSIASVKAMAGALEGVIGR